MVVLDGFRSFLLLVITDLQTADLNCGMGTVDTTSSLLFRVPDEMLGRR